MNTVTQEEWINELKQSDFGIVLGTSFFAKVQNFFRRKMNKKRSDEDQVTRKASHTFGMMFPPQMSEADGKIVNNNNKVQRYFSDHHKIWICRYTSLTGHQNKAIQRYYVEQAKKRYSWGLVIKEYVKKLFKKNYKMKDKKGTVCSEHQTRVAQKNGLVFIEKEPQEVTPSMMLDWMYDKGFPSGTWELAAYYANGHFYLPK